jgi:hypothetical protein
LFFTLKLHDPSPRNFMLSYNKREEDSREEKKDELFRDDGKKEECPRFSKKSSTPEGFAGYPSGRPPGALLGEYPTLEDYGRGRRNPSGHDRGIR